MINAINGAIKMNHQLVIKFSDENYSIDDIVKVEDKIIEKIDNESDLDGHDIGSGEVAFFIFTNNPKKCFESLINSSIFRSMNLLQAAYRKTDSEVFTVLYSSTGN
ncbi:hypothetical protein [Desulfuromonas acetoxidans]|uniref:hypothetical protein n=1 Tax=Desulfuromonas acetoxidans TaxID=891 RepID=UPI00292D03F6